MTFFELAVGIFGFLFLLSASVTLTLNLRPLYYLDMELLHIPEESGYTRELVKENYDALITYNNITCREELNFRDMPMSDGARIHFKEVKRIFGLFEYLAIISGILFAGGGFWLWRRRRYGWMKTASICSIAIPAAVGIFIAVDWQETFILFHELVFQNDYWLFDPASDPIITILPDTYFFHCAALIVCLILCGSLLLYLLYKNALKRIKKIN